MDQYQGNGKTRGVIEEKAQRYNGEDEDLESLGDIRDFSNGGTVVHPHFGKGMVLSQSNDGRFVKVQFDCGIRNVWTDTLNEA